MTHSSLASASEGEIFYEGSDVSQLEQSLTGALLAISGPQRAAAFRTLALYLGSAKVMGEHVSHWGDQELVEEGISALLEQWLRRDQGIVVTTSARALLHTSLSRSIARLARKRRALRAHEVCGPHDLAQAAGFASQEVSLLSEQLPLLGAYLGAPDVDARLVNFLITHIIPLHPARTRARDIHTLHQRAHALGIPTCGSTREEPLTPAAHQKRASRLRQRFKATLKSRQTAALLSPLEATLLSQWIRRVLFSRSL